MKDPYFIACVVLSLTIHLNGFAFGIIANSTRNSDAASIKIRIVNLARERADKRHLASNIEQPLPQKSPALSAAKPKTPQDKRQPEAFDTALASAVTPVKETEQLQRAKKTLPDKSSPKEETKHPDGAIPSEEGAGQASSTGRPDSAFGPVRVEAKPLDSGNIRPSYPRIARRHGWQGEVWLKVQVDNTGRVVSVQVDRSSGYGILDKTALEAVRNWRFHAARIGSKRVESEVRVPIRFELLES